MKQNNNKRTLFVLHLSLDIQNKYCEEIQVYQKAQ